MKQLHEKAPCLEKQQPDQIMEPAMLQPQFDNFPKGKKIPYDPTRLNSKANVKDPYSWGSFNQVDAAYSEGGWLGVGFVLIGNGADGVDIGKGVIDGVTKTEAIQLLTDMGAAYVEHSPSRNGLHTFGLVKQSNSGVRGQLVDLLIAKVNAGTNS
jgi:primase-polymerase (primpol)-like protein